VGIVVIILPDSISHLRAFGPSHRHNVERPTKLLYLVTVRALVVVCLYPFAYSIPGVCAVCLIALGTQL
jgi:hypothetical protein